MKTYVLKLIPSVILLLLIVSACKKKEDTQSGFTHRIVSEKWYENDILYSETSYEYTDNKLSRIYSQDYGEVSSTEEDLITYPSANSIVVTYSSSVNGTRTSNITLTNNQVTEVLESDWKATVTYNSDGNPENVKEYSFVSTWTLDYETTYTYNSGKLVQVSEIEYGGNGNYEDKYDISYSGDELVEQIHSILYPGGTWTEYYKYVYTYTNGKISKINYLSKDGSWYDSYYEDFTYDNFGNLITINNPDVNYNYRTDYTYEEANGNYRLFWAFFGYDYMYPIPNKKSQGPVRDFSKHPRFNHINSVINKMF
jgi:hypothetical protein